jgi:peptidoglycan/LPS O-acetylase OafA/YrhL
MGSASPQRANRADIEGLRALAVLAVIATHVAPAALPGGFAGVDVFFVISGYLIGMHLLQDIEAGRFSFLGFYARRARRLLPALCVVLVAVWAIGWRLLSAPEFESLGRHIAAATIFANNFQLWSESGYFDVVSTSKPLLHLWSLGVEEQFYLLVPLLLWLGSRGRETSIRWVVRLSVLSLLVMELRPEPSFYLLDTRFWELGAGVALGYLQLQTGSSAAASRQAARAGAPQRRAVWDRLLALPARHAGLLREASAVAGIGLIAISCCAASPHDWPGPQTLLPVLGTVLVIAAGSAAAVNRGLGLRPLVFVGGISYPLYLWHWPAIVFGQMLARAGRPVGELTPVWLAFLLAWATRKLIEDPVRFGRLGGGRVTRPPVWMLAVGLIATGVLGLSTVAKEGFGSRFSPALSAVANWSAQGGAGDWRLGQCYYNPSNSAAFAQDCTPSRRAGHARLLLWGDSHAAHLYPGLLSLQQTQDFDLIQWTAAACPPTVTALAVEQPSCPQIRARELRELRAAAPDIVLLSAAWELYLEKGVREDAIVAAIGEDLRALRAAGIGRIVVFGPGPTWNTSLAMDLFRYMTLRHTEQIPARFGTVSVSTQHLDAAMAAQALKEGAGYVSILAHLCTVDGCRIVGGEGSQPIPLFLDRDHFTVAGSRLLIRAVATQILRPQPPVAPGGR